MSKTSSILLCYLILSKKIFLIKIFFYKSLDWKWVVPDYMERIYCEHKRYFFLYILYINIFILYLIILIHLYFCTFTSFLLPICCIKTVPFLNLFGHHILKKWFNQIKYLYITRHLLNPKKTFRNQVRQNTKYYT